MSFQINCWLRTRTWPLQFLLDDIVGIGLLIEMERTLLSWNIPLIHLREKGNKSTDGAGTWSHTKAQFLQHMLQAAAHTSVQWMSQYFTLCASEIHTQANQASNNSRYLEIHIFEPCSFTSLYLVNIWLNQLAGIFPTSTLVEISI